MSTESIRIDRWLWFARFFKSRTIASTVVSGGGVRLNGVPISKPKVEVRPGDEVRFPQNKIERVVVVVACGVRRGPATEAQALYDDKTPEPDQKPDGPAFVTPSRERGAGRPTKRDRRALDRLRPE